MSNSEQTTDEAKHKETLKRFRERIAYEDSLLNTRTSLFLVVNGLVAVAVRIDATISSTVMVMAVAILINSLWLVTAHKSLSVIKKLTVNYLNRLKDGPDDEIEKIVQEALHLPLWLRPTNILCHYIPFSVFLGWLIAFIVFIARHGLGLSNA